MHGLAHEGHDGSIVASETQEAGSNAAGLPKALRQLAEKLAGQLQAEEPTQAAAPALQPQASRQPDAGGSGFFDGLAWVPHLQFGGPGLDLTFADQSQANFDYGNGTGLALQALQKDGWFADLGVSSGNLQGITLTDADGQTEELAEGFNGTASAGHLNLGYQYHLARLGEGWFSPIRVYAGLGAYWGEYAWQFEGQAEQTASFGGLGMQIGATYTAWDRWFFGIMSYNSSGTLTSENQALVDQVETADANNTHFSVGYRF